MSGSFAAWDHPHPANGPHSKRNRTNGSASPTLGARRLA